MSSGKDLLFYIRVPPPFLVIPVALFSGISALCQPNLSPLRRFHLVCPVTNRLMTRTCFPFSEQTPRFPINIRTPWQDHPPVVPLPFRFPRIPSVPLFPRLNRLPQISSYLAPFATPCSPPLQVLSPTLAFPSKCPSSPLPSFIFYVVGTRLRPPDPNSPLSTGGPSPPFSAPAVFSSRCCKSTHLKRFCLGIPARSALP